MQINMKIKYRVFWKNMWNRSIRYPYITSVVIYMMLENCCSVTQLVELLSTYLIADKYANAKILVQLRIKINNQSLVKLSVNHFKDL